MNRKGFLSSFAASMASVPAFTSVVTNTEVTPDKPLLIPPYLNAGDLVGITCPAGYITAKEIASAVQQIQEWGFTVKSGDTVGKRDFTFGGTDQERAHDFQEMLDDESIKAIMCARGGYGSIRIIDEFDFSKFVRHPKWIIGFSDITIIHSHLNRNYNIASLHSKMCNSFPDDWSKAEPVQIDCILSIKQALTGEKMKYAVPPHEKNKNGIAEGALVGGNLKTLESLAASKSDIQTAGKMLFLEDTGEYLYSIDRMLWNLKRTGKLSGLTGLIIGGFKVKPDDAGEDFGRTLQEIVLEKIKEYSYPVCFDFPVGHQKDNYALKCGMIHRLSVSNEEATLIEI